MFEGWAADVLASYIGKFVNVQRDSLKISLWGGNVFWQDMFHVPTWVIWSHNLVCM
jgi:hypothetical protein